ncbi:GILT-like protein 1 [Drosophila guanche]|uniref:Blast:GILT-like protein C02D5.2 n=1 Tax=Drosophila guanche TaxID=7266 RepID=A0A3B0K0N2_DROGU|nr:GILT-like protein 1 [Drosophila guanche]SPP87865.1 blast:GILT-like protein C02D5.2 [Drosophila guanche]
MSHKFIGAFLLLSCLVAAVHSAAKVPVAIYYESLCPDSAKFITEQLYPAVKGELRDVVDLTFVPFGKSQFFTQGSEVTFTCHHGPNECYGNKVHACAIEHIQANSYQIEYTRESLTLDFINCLMRAGKNFPDNVYPGQRCATENHINNWENIKTCANTTEGSQLLRKAGEATGRLKEPLTSVPSVLFNEQFEKKVNDRAQVNFIGTLCQYVSAPQPRICAQHNAAAATGLASVSAILSSLLGLWFIRSFY